MRRMESINAGVIATIGYRKKTRAPGLLSTPGHAVARQAPR
jgi:hypothetical protein